MPALPFQCPLCGRVLQIDTAWAGQQVACPLCQGVIVVPPAAALAAMIGSSGGQTDLLPPLRQAAPLVETKVAIQDRRRLSRAEKSQRRLRKNLILFGICIVALVMVFYFLTR